MEFRTTLQTSTDAMQCVHLQGSWETMAEKTSGQGAPPLHL